MFLCVKKDEFTASCKHCNKNINVAHMDLVALKQHSEKKIHIGFCAQLVEGCIAKQTGSVKRLTTQGTETVVARVMNKNVDRMRSLSKRMMIHNIV